MLAGVLLGLLTAASLWLRCRRYRQGPADTETSPLALAVQELLATAGGVYLSLLAVFSFLKCPVPEAVRWQGVEADPVALASLVCSIVQPFGNRLKHRRR